MSLIKISRTKSNIFEFLIINYSKSNMPIYSVIFFPRPEVVESTQDVEMVTLNVIAESQILSAFISFSVNNETFLALNARNFLFTLLDRNYKSSTVYQDTIDAILVPFVAEGINNLEFDDDELGKFINRHFDEFLFLINYQYQNMRENEIRFKIVPLEVKLIIPRI